jgi:type IV pilus assembly protein PilQ
MRRAKSLVYAAASGVALFASVARADGASNHVRDVRVHAASGAQGSAEVEIVGSGAPAYNLRLADGGRRLLVDLSDSDVVGAPAAITTPIGIVGGVLTQSYDTPAGHMARLTINLNGASSYRVVPDASTLKVVLTPSGPPAPAPAGATPLAGAPAGARSKRTSRTPPAARPTAATASSSTSAASPRTRSRRRPKATFASSCAPPTCPRLSRVRST